MNLMSLRIPALLILYAFAAFCLPARAADPQTYKVDLASTGNRDLDTTLKATSDLASLRSSAPVSPFGLIGRARSDIDRLITVLESYGYYEAKVAIKINGMALIDPGLGDALTALPKGTDAKVAITFTLGQIYHLRKIDIDGDWPDSIDVRATLDLKPGQLAVAANVLASTGRVLTALQEQGYAFARVDPPVAYEAAEGPVLDLKFHVTAGHKVNIGQIHIEGLKRVREKVARGRLLIHSGDLYQPSVIEKARHDLLALNVFAQVSVQTGTQPDESGGVPLTFKIRERLRHLITVSAAYSSDLGGSGGSTWTDRNLFGNADQLSLTASVINLGGSDTTGIGYDTNAKYVIPEFLHRDQSLQFSIGAIKQSLQAYDQTAKTSSVILSRKLSSIWSVSAGFATADEQIVQAGNTNFYTLVAAPFVVAYDSTNLASPLDDPRHGFRGSVSVTPTLAIGHPDATFIISQIKLATFFDLNNLLPLDPGRTVLAARGLAGLAQGAGELSLPPDQRFYGGGSGTIRGYRYQSVGPVFTSPPSPPSAAGIPIGGTGITAATLELRQRVGTNFGFAVFIDAGQVSASLRATPEEIRVGAGAGVRYYTPIGPIRLDVALPTKNRPGQDAFDIYIGLGQSF
jgi:translocation and assembly module TamA